MQRLLISGGYSMIKIIVRYYEVDNQGNKYMHAKRFNSDDDARVFIDEIRKSLNLLWYEIDVREED